MPSPRVKANSVNRDADPPPKILIIEDNETFREAIKARCERSGYRVKTVAGHQCLYGNSLRGYDLIISDAETDNPPTLDSDGERFLRGHADEVGKKTIAISSEEVANYAMQNVGDPRRNAIAAVRKPKFSSDTDKLNAFLDKLMDVVPQVIGQTYNADLGR